MLILKSSHAVINDNKDKIFKRHCFELWEVLNTIKLGPDSMNTCLPRESYRFWALICICNYFQDYATK